MIQSYDIQIPAGGTQLLEVSAQIFDFLSSGSAFDVIQVLPEFQQGNVSLKLGQGFDAGKIVNRWFVKNPGTTAINGTVVLSTAGFRNFRISGDVNVLDGGKSRTLAQQAFCANVTCPSAVASLYGRAQVWNPANSGKRVIVESITVVPASGSSATVGAVFNTAQLATVLGNGLSKLSGGPASSAVFAQDTNAAGPAGITLWQFQAPVSGLDLFPMREPYVILPGNGLLLWSMLSNSQFAADIEWYEEPNT